MKVSWIKYLIAGIILTGIIIFLAPGIYNGVVNTIPSSGPTPISTVSPESIATSHPVQTIHQEEQLPSPVLEKMKETIRQFANSPVTDIQYVGKNRFIVDSSQYTIDNVSGRVDSVSPIKYGSHAEDQKEIIDLEQGYVIAETFAREKSPEFWNVSDTRIVKNGVKKVEGNRNMRFDWFESYLVPDKNTPNHLEIQGSNSIEINVDPFTGKVIGYFERYTPSVITGIAPVNLTPTITKEQAQKIAEDHFPTMRVRNQLLAVADYYDDGIPHLVWGFSMTSKNRDAPVYLDRPVDVDAHNGTIL